MSINSVLKGCHEVLLKSEAQHVVKYDFDFAAACALQAEAVARLVEELKKEEETSDE